LLGGAVGPWGRGARLGEARRAGPQTRRPARQVAKQAGSACLRVKTLIRVTIRLAGLCSDLDSTSHSSPLSPLPSSLSSSVIGFPPPQTPATSNTVHCFTLLTHPSSPPALSHAQPLCMAQLKSAMMNCGPSLKPLKNLSICRDTAIKGAIVLQSTNEPPENYYNIANHAETCNCPRRPSHSCQSLGAENEIKPADAAIKALSRKAFIEVQDYDYGGANSRHDPRRGKPGNGGKNP
ncbi:hypothetical protein ACMD2_06454, partial [Ananas comosus]